jgi:hypothetical protein
MKKKTNKRKNQIPLWKRIPIVGVWKDIVNYRAWIQAIKEEAFNPNSKFNKFGMNFNFFYVLYLPVSLPREDAQLPEDIKRLRLMEVLTPIHQYIDNDLGFAGSIVPEFNQFYDDEDNPTLTYGIVYRFAFDTLSLKWVITRVLFTGIAIWAIAKFHLFGLAIDTIKGLL